MNADYKRLPATARRMVDLAVAAGMAVKIEVTDNEAHVAVEDEEIGDRWSMWWRRRGNGWRLNFTTDGWTENMTLREIATYWPGEK